MHGNVSTVLVACHTGLLMQFVSAVLVARHKGLLEYIKSRYFSDSNGQSAGPGAHFTPRLGEGRFSARQRGLQLSSFWKRPLAGLACV